MTTLKKKGGDRKKRKRETKRFKRKWGQCLWEGLPPCLLFTKFSSSFFTNKTSPFALWLHNPTRVQILKGCYEHKLKSRTITYHSTSKQNTKYKT
jgi:hypothetical protein